MIKINLLKETKEAILGFNLKIEDIIFIGITGECSCSWEEFKQYADIEYDDGYGDVEININLIIAFKDKTIMRRVEYDGSEGWECIDPFKMPENTKPMKRENLYD